MRVHSIPRGVQGRVNNSLLALSVLKNYVGQCIGVSFSVPVFLILCFWYWIIWFHLSNIDGSKLLIWETLVFILSVKIFILLQSLQYIWALGKCSRHIFLIVCYHIICHWVKLVVNRHGWILSIFRLLTAFFVEFVFLLFWLFLVTIGGAVVSGVVFNLSSAEVRNLSVAKPSFPLFVVFDNKSLYIMNLMC